MNSSNQIRTFVLTGPESSGKSSLCEALATEYSSLRILEFARSYLQERKGEYGFNDLEVIAKAQNLQIDREMSLGNGLIFVDTWMYVMKIWSEEKFNRCSRYILNQLSLSDSKAYILCTPDFPWEQDELREHPEGVDRMRLFHVYKAHLESQAQPYIIVSGTKKERLNKATQFVNDFIN